MQQNPQEKYNVKCFRYLEFSNQQMSAQELLHRLILMKNEGRMRKTLLILMMKTTKVGTVYKGNTTSEYQNILAFTYLNCSTS